MMMMIKGVVPQKSITIIKQSQTDSKHSRPLWDVEGEKRDKIRFLLGGIWAMKTSTWTHYL